MADKTGIEWTDATWNPVVGCRKVSEGCRNCYAMRDAARTVARMRGLASTPRRDATLAAYEATVRMDDDGNPRPVWSGRASLRPEVLDQPLRWRKPRRIFVNSMSDLFHEDVPFEFVAAVFRVMAQAERHTFQVLTKRPARMLEFLTACASWEGWVTHDGGPPNGYGGTSEVICGDNKWPLPNVWIGVSVEDQATADERVPLLLQCPAAVRWLSMEPLLGPVDLHTIDPGGEYVLDVLRWRYRPRHTEPSDGATAMCFGWAKYGRINWVVVGGESGPDARPMHPQWVRDIRDQCAAAGVPFLFKQWGEWAPGAEQGYPNAWVRTDGSHGSCLEDAGHEDAVAMSKVGKKRAGRTLDEHTHDEYPAVRP